MSIFSNMFDEKVTELNRVESQLAVKEKQLVWSAERIATLEAEVKALRAFAEFVLREHELWLCLCAETHGLMDRDHNPTPLLTGKAGEEQAT